MTDWSAWTAGRPKFTGLHLDSAAAGRSSHGVLDAVAGHSLREAQIGAYQAEAEAEATIAGGRAVVATLVGVPAEGVAFVESAADGLERLLAAWPIQAGDEIAVTPSEWGPNRVAFTGRGLRLTELAIDRAGRVDLDRLADRLRRDPPAVVHLTQVAAHRGLLQPVAEAAVICRAAGVALWVDAAQALGHVDLATSADATWATSRKWLGGPRGVGFLAVAQSWWSALRIPLPVLAAPDVAVLHRFEDRERSVAGIVGFCTALREFAENRPADVQARLVDVGRLTRETLADLPGWQVVDGQEATGITALRPTDDQDVTATRQQLLERFAILTTASLPVRAPGEMTHATLRISPHVDCAAGDLRRLRDALINLRRAH